MSVSSASASGELGMEVKSVELDWDLCRSLTSDKVDSSVSATSESSVESCRSDTPQIPNSDFPICSALKSNSGVSGTNAPSSFPQMFSAFWSSSMPLPPSDADSHWPTPESSEPDMSLRDPSSAANISLGWISSTSRSS